MNYAGERSMYRCKFCKRMYSSISARARHQRLKHGQFAIGVNCPSCNKCLTRRLDVVRHHERVHGSTIFDVPEFTRQDTDLSDAQIHSLPNLEDEFEYYLNDNVVYLPDTEEALAFLERTCDVDLGPPPVELTNSDGKAAFPHREEETPSTLIKECIICGEKITNNSSDNNDPQHNIMREYANQYCKSWND